MTKFMMGIRKETTVTASKKSHPFLCEFVLPDWARERIPYEEAIKLEGRIVLTAYADPQIGDRIHYLGHEWKVVGRVHYPYRPYSREVKLISKIEFEYIGPVPADPENAP